MPTGSVALKPQASFLRQCLHALHIISYLRQISCELGVSEYNQRRIPTMKRLVKHPSSSPLFCTSNRTIPLLTPLSLTQCLHNTTPNPATPLPITAAGPPPSAPLPAVSQYGQRVDRRRRQAELLKKGQDLRASHMKPGSAMKKRFWKDVSVKTIPGTSCTF